MNDRHQPDPEFVSRLQWQLDSEIRRSNRGFGVESSSGWLGRSLRTAALIVLCLSLGGAGVVAAQKYAGSWQTQLWLARAETALELAQARTRIFEEELERVQQDQRDQPEMLLLMEEELAATRLDQEKAMLNLREVQATGLAPRDDLNAPLVSGADFVSLRLELELARLGERASRVRSYWEHVGQLRSETAEAGMIQLELAQIQAQQDQLSRRLQLRHQFLDGELSAREVQLRERLAVVETEFFRMQNQLEMAERQWQMMLNQGEDAQIQARRAELDLASVRAQARLLATERRLLQAQLSR